ncbi:hypothetical protein EDB81DRAFT_810328 [Dactylonectria macrodidyma]|uniref:Protein kinase domain-containing protein n=1 Tax=Dactylonectria macrodidyma TaxID=307937 RepID=A0A9P9DV97_9HYPO|nr:hypothetical protein EDB81DRAFT_810328 [Dactylonectria macrodidyma]
MAKEKDSMPWKPRPWARLHQPHNIRWITAALVLTLSLGSLYGVSLVKIHRRALVDKFSPTAFDHLIAQEDLNLKGMSWKWNDYPKREIGSARYSRDDIWAHRHEWKKLGAGSEGEAFTHNGTVIKVYKKAHHPFRNCVPDTSPEMRWPTEIAASLLLGGMVDSQPSHQDMEFLPVTDYFMSPATQGEPPRWHFLTPFLPSGNIIKLAKHLRNSEHTYTAHELDLVFRPSLERLLQALTRMHSQHNLCHDDIKPDNIWLAGSKDLGSVGDDLEEVKHWILADLGNVREPNHPYHSSILWSRLNDNLPDCRMNDVLRLLKSYLLFLRASVDDTAVFDSQFFQANEGWAQLYWNTLDAVQAHQLVSASSVQSLPDDLDLATRRLRDPSVSGRDPLSLWNAWHRLFLSREHLFEQAARDELKMTAADRVARIWGMTSIFGVPVGRCRG